jgi:hypothetical protein
VTTFTTTTVKPWGASRNDWTRSGILRKLDSLSSGSWSERSDDAEHESALLPLPAQARTFAGSLPAELTETLAGDPDERRMRKLLTIGRCGLDDGSDFLASLGADLYVERLRATLADSDESLLLLAARDSGNPLLMVLARYIAAFDAADGMRGRRQGIELVAINRIENGSEWTWQGEPMKAAQDFTGLNVQTPWGEFCADQVSHVPADPGSIDGAPPPPERNFQDRTPDDEQPERIPGPNQDQATIAATLTYFKLAASVRWLGEGPTRTTWELVPQPGTPVRKLVAMERDLGVALGRPNVSVEVSDKVLLRVPHEKPRTVNLADVIDPGHELPLLLGVGDVGESLTADLAKLPHLLIGGSTGSGKTVALNALVAGLAASKSRGWIELRCIDSKRIGLVQWQDNPLQPSSLAVTTAEALALLQWLVREMDARYVAVRAGKSIDRLPWQAVVIDELADLTTCDQAPAFLFLLDLLLRKGRQARIHVIAATQELRVAAVPGKLKANFPARMAFRAASAVDSRVILDPLPTGRGAESLTCPGEFIFRHGADLKRGRAAVQ